MAPEETGRLLDVIADRVASGRTGAVWQRRTVEALEPGIGRGRELAVMLERYVDLMNTGAPVHTWPAGRPGEGTRWN